MMFDMSIIVFCSCFTFVFYNTGYRCRKHKEVVIEIIE